MANNQEEKMDKHRFLIQSKSLDENIFQRLAEMDPSARAEEVLRLFVSLYHLLTLVILLQLTKIWDGPKDDRKNIKLKVEFRYPEQSSVRSSSADRGFGPDAFRAGVARKPSTDDSASVANTPELMLTELQNMRKKYDAVVEYTVHLTAERDAIVAQLENLQRELNKEKAKKKGDNGVKGQGDKVERRVVDKVSHLILFLDVLFVAIHAAVVHATIGLLLVHRSIGSFAQLFDR
jgi:hypothetical protein